MIKKQMKMRSKKGITLVALIITIIVMLILAGVSINAIVGDNGIIKQAMNTNFLAEMTEIQEAFDVWRVSNSEDALAPTNGIVKQNTITSRQRLAGEIGYYRIWSISGKKSSKRISENNDIFEKDFGGEIVYYPGGAVDLYYLDTDAIGVKTNNKYIIDVADCMIYSLNGYNTDGILVYSLSMFNIIHNNNSLSPDFAEVEAKKRKGDINSCWKY